MTPSVTPEGDVVLDLMVENSTRGQDVNIAGQNLPSFGTRRVNTRLRLRDGESNLLAGLIREQDRKTLRGVPGLLRLPILSKLLASNDTSIDQTDIVMLLTPRIVRTRELSQSDLSPIFIGTQQNIGLGGPPPLIAAPAAPTVGQAPSPAGTPAPPAAATGVPTPAPAPAQSADAGEAGGMRPPSSAGATVVLTPPGNDFRVGGGPYTVAVSATDAARLSSVSLTLTYNPTALRVRTVQEGSFMRAGGIVATFTQQVDAGTGRIDIAITRTGDATGAAGTGLLSAILFDAIAPGAANFTVTGTGSVPGGGSASLQFDAPPAVSVR